MRPSDGLMSPPSAHSERPQMAAFGLVLGPRAGSVGTANINTCFGLAAKTAEPATTIQFRPPPGPRPSSSPWPVVGPWRAMWGHFECCPRRPLPVPISGR